jgi:arginine-tRNA-protein transferase
MKTTEENREIPFYITEPDDCPYLPERFERKLVTPLEGEGAATLYGVLSLAGFRRSGSWAYRPDCVECSSCVAVRMILAETRIGPAWKRVLRENRRVVESLVPPRATDELWSLFHRYVTSRHGDGEMAAMDRSAFVEMLVGSPIDTRLLLLREPDGRLLAAALVDRLFDGWSAVYSFFEPELPRRSLGSLAVLRLAARARARGLPYVYLGYWVAGSAKMAYKIRFAPLEGWDGERWVRLDPERFPPGDAAG